MNAVTTFLKFGNETGTGPQDMRLDEVPGLISAMRSSGPEIISLLRDADNRDASVFALAMAVSFGNSAVRRSAFVALPDICLTSDQLFAFCSACKGLRGWGRGMRNSIAGWYAALSPERLVALSSEVDSRGEWTHRDLLRMAHPKPPTELHRLAFRDMVSGRRS